MSVLSSLQDKAKYKILVNTDTIFFGMKAFVILNKKSEFWLIESVKEVNKKSVTKM